MSTIFLIISLGLGLLLEWSIGLKFSFWLLSPPLFVFFLILWLWGVSFNYGLALGIISGFILDSVYVAPLGTYSFLFLGLVLLVNVLRSVFSVNESLLVRAFFVGVCIFCFMIFQPVAAFAFSALSNVPYFPGVPTYQLALGALFWSLVLPVIFYGIIWALRYFKLGVSYYDVSFPAK